MWHNERLPPPVRDGGGQLFKRVSYAKEFCLCLPSQYLASDQLLSARVSAQGCSTPGSCCWSARIGVSEQQPRIAVGRARSRALSRAAAQSAASPLAVAAQSLLLPLLFPAPAPLLCCPRRLRNRHPLFQTLPSVLYLQLPTLCHVLRTPSALIQSKNKTTRG